MEAEAAPVDADVAPEDADVAPVEAEVAPESIVAEDVSQPIDAGVGSEPVDVGAGAAVTEFEVGPEVPAADAFEEAAEHDVAGAPVVDAPVDGDAAGVESGADGDAAGVESGADGDPVAVSAPSSGIPAQGRRGRGGGAASGGSSPRTEEVKRESAGKPVSGSADEGERQEPELKPLDDAELRAALEAILLVVDEPVAEMQLAQIVEQPTERVAAMLEDISARYTAAGHGFDLRRAAGGWRLYTRPEYAPYVERFVLDGQSVRLTQAALETLAVVAYKQPVTRSRISAIRGVNCDGVMRTLVTRGLIEECGTEGETGAFLYRTTALFLEKLGLNSVDQLPPLAPFLPDDVEEVLDASG
nr:SMC-Scp complex subunit ScpB [Couchioplanes caeruleus]